MGNRAVITFKGAKEKDIGVYVHWNGGVECVEAFCAYCDMKGFRYPETDCYGLAYLTTIIGNYFGDGLSLGIDRLECLDTDNFDNGVYYIENWKIVERSYKMPLETDKKLLYSYLVSINDCQGENIRVPKAKIISYCKKNNIPVPKEEKEEKEEKVEK